MTLHKEGNKIIAISFFVLVALSFGSFYLLSSYPVIFGLSILAFLILFVIIIFFFRSPLREVIPNNTCIMAPADGKVVVIEETMEPEYFKDKRIQVSIFMSPLDVHVNWCPVSGTVKYFEYHDGRYIVAFNPKSSDKNERTSLIIENENTTILVRQVAGFLARRIVTYPKVNEFVTQGNELGFIKFGSRVDLFLPLDAKLNVSLNQKVKGNTTVIARLK